MRDCAAGLQVAEQLTRAAERLEYRTWFVGSASIASPNHLTASSNFPAEKAALPLA
jgi:hypothetical protein